MKRIYLKIACWCCMILAGQSLSLYSQHCNLLNPEMRIIADQSPNTAWLYFKESAAIEANEIFIRHAKEFRLPASDEMRKMKVIENPMTGFTQEKYYQYHEGIRVYGGSIMLFSRNGIAVKAKGNIIQNLPSLPVTTMSEEQAIELAIVQMPGKDYLWEDEERVAKYRLRKNDPSASLAPRAQMLYIADSLTSIDGGKYHLCWKVEVGMQRSGSYTIYLDAQTGAFLKKSPLFNLCNGTTVATPMNGDQTIYTTVTGRCDNASSYELWDNCEVDIKVENDDLGSGDDDPICDSDNSWATTFGLGGDGVQLLWGMRTTYDWYLSRYGWDSYNGDGGSVDCTVMYEFGDFEGDDGNNAQYEIFEEDFDFGYGDEISDPEDSYTALDIAAHEFTHGVNDYTIDSDQGGESGAINESFSDIFGEAIEQMTVSLSESEKWLVGQAKSNGGIRSIKNPNDSDDPKTYLSDPFWYSGSDDSKWVHTNNGVQNYFFYLLAEGGSGVNANGDSYSVNGIGIFKAIDIAWLVLAGEYIEDAEGYAVARDAWLEAAKDLYGNCSNEMIQVGYAWSAVGVAKYSVYNIYVVSDDVFALTGDNTIQAIDQIYTDGGVEINSFSDFEVRFYSGREVILKPGFVSESGTTFVAKINPCSVTLHSDPQKVSADESVTSDPKQNSMAKDAHSTYPNPFQDQFTFQWNSPVEYGSLELKVYDLMGREIFQRPWNVVAGNNEIIIDAGAWKSGMYLLRLFDDDVIIAIERLVKM